MRKKELLKEQSDEAKAKDAERKADLQAAIEDSDKRAQEGDETTKAANEKLSAYYKSSSALIGAMDSVKAEDYDDARKLEIKKLKKTQSEAEGKLSGTTFVDGKVAADKEEGETILKDMKANVDESLKDFNALIDDFGDQKTETEEAIDAAKEIEDDKKGDLDLLGDDAGKDELQAAQKAYYEAQIVTQQAKKADAAAEGEDETKFDTKITELQGKINALDDGGGTTEKTSQQLADDFIADNEGFKVITDKGAEVPVTNPDTGEDEQKPRYEDVQDFTGKKEDGSDDDVVTVGKEIDYTNNTDEAKTVEEVAKESIGDGFDEYKKIPVGEQQKVHPERTGDDGIAIPGKAMWTDVKGPFKAKDETGAETGDGVFYGKPQSNESVATVTGAKLNEGMSVAEKFAILMNK